VARTKQQAATKPPAARRRLRKADYQALGAFRYAIRSFLAFSEAGARKLGLTAQQHQALLAIFVHAGDEPMTIGELAESLIIKNHSAVGLVERLEKKGLVRRTQSSRDRRRVVLEVTAEAEAKLAVISRNNMGELNRKAETIEGLLETLRRLSADGLWSEQP
jgi:DNA-binding MarR family transcriptional regulator